MKNILTIDLEDWYQGVEILPREWCKYEDRIEESVGSLLEILDNNGTKATFFVLGYIAENCPGLVKEIAQQGHEIGTHGYGHEFVYKLTPYQFDSDLRLSIDLLEQAIGRPVRTYRAPYFSITEESLWAMDVLAENGIEYDSSIFPIKNYRYGVPNAPRHPHMISTVNGNLFEIPVSTVRMLGGNLSFTGGFYLRFFPYYLIKQAIRRINGEGLPAVIYLHPWELDPEHPRLKLPLRVRLTHYHNLASTSRKLSALMRDFEFSSVIDVVEGNGDVPHVEYLSFASGG